MLKFEGNLYLSLGFDSLTTYASAVFLTFAGAENGRVDEQQQGVVQEALQHGRLHPSVGQVLTAHCCPTDQQGQHLPHDDGLQQTPGELSKACVNEMQSNTTAPPVDS